MAGGAPITKFKPETVQAIIEEIAQSVPVKLAAESKGVHVSTWYKWIDQGEEDLNSDKNSDYAKLVETLRCAQAKRAKKLMKNIEVEKHGHKGSEWILERTMWRYYSATGQNIELSERIDKLESEQKDKLNLNQFNPIKSQDNQP